MRLFSIRKNNFKW